ncbi:MAG: hypothetical protein GQ574_09555 [Crocinitomix sp.]|nr:hypothetical protein [Crocinitomix sp.]
MKLIITFLVVLLIAACDSSYEIDPKNDSKKTETENNYIQDTEIEIKDTVELKDSPYTLLDISEIAYGADLIDTAISVSLLDSVLDPTFFSYSDEKEMVSLIHYNDGDLHGDLEVTVLNRARDFFVLNPKNLLSHKRKLKYGFGGVSIEGVFVLHKSVLYFFGFYRFNPSGADKSKRHEIFSAIIKFNRSFEEVSLVQFNLGFITGTEAGERAVMFINDEKSKVRAFDLDYDNYGDQFVTDYFEILEDSSRFWESKSYDLEVRVKSLKYSNWRNGGLIFFKEDSVKSSH